MTEEKIVEETSKKDVAPKVKDVAPKVKEATPKVKEIKPEVKESAKATEEVKKSTSNASVAGATPAQIVKVFKKAGLYGECYQVLARIVEGRDKGNLLRRNVRGPVKENDILMLKETERDARAI